LLPASVNLTVNEVVERLIKHGAHLDHVGAGDLWWTPNTVLRGGKP
jgi:hypothetical protein